jgi:hypothetical protein
MSAKTFVLGVGGQKAGTTWLHDYLDGLPDTDFGFTKEYHVWDSLCQPPLRRATHVVRDTALRLTTIARKMTRGGAGVQGIEADWLHIQRKLRASWFVLFPERYFAYFDSLLQRPGVSLTGDITPSYAGLSEEKLRSIRDRIRARGIEVRVLLLMRDPVERCWSEVRMLRRNAEKRGRIGTPRGLLSADEEAHLRNAYNSRTSRTRTRYDATIAAMEGVFAPEEVLYGFFEQLFREETVRELCDKLGVGYRQPAFDVAVNESEKDADISLELRAEIANYYGDTYRNIAARFGEERIAGIWKNYALVR